MQAQACGDDCARDDEGVTLPYIGYWEGVYYTVGNRKGGNVMADFEGLKLATVSAGALGFSFDPGGTDIPDVVALDKIIEAIEQRIAEGKKPSATLRKQLERISDHRAQLEDAITKLFGAYARMTAEVPYQRGSVAAKARRDMLAAMTDKVLKEFAKVYLDDVSEYVLPDDRAQLEADVLKTMATVQAEA